MDSDSDSEIPELINFAQFLEHSSHPDDAPKPSQELNNLVEQFKVRDQEEEKLLTRSTGFQLDSTQASAIAWKVVLKKAELQDIESISHYFRYPIQGVFQDSLEAGYGLVKNTKSCLTLGSGQLLKSLNSALNKLWDYQAEQEENEGRFLYILGEGLVVCFQNQKRPECSVMTSSKQLRELFSKSTSDQALQLSTGKQFCINTVNCDQINKVVSKLTLLAANQKVHLELLANYEFDLSSRKQVKCQWDQQDGLVLSGPLFGSIMSDIQKVKRERLSSVEVHWVEESRWLGLAHHSPSEMELNMKHLLSIY